MIQQAINNAINTAANVKLQMDRNNALNNRDSVKMSVANNNADIQKETMLNQAQSFEQRKQEILGKYSLDNKTPLTSIVHNEKQLKAVKKQLGGSK